MGEEWRKAKRTKEEGKDVTESVTEASCTCSCAECFLCCLVDNKSITIFHTEQLDSILLYREKK